MAVLSLNEEEIIRIISKHFDVKDLSVSIDGSGSSVYIDVEIDYNDIKNKKVE